MDNHVTINGTKYAMRFNMTAIANYEKLTGKSGLKMTEEDWQLAGTYIALAYVGIKQANPEVKLTYNQVGDSLKSSAFQKIARQWSHDIAEMTEEEDEDQGN